MTICVIDVRCGNKLDKVELCHVPDEIGEEPVTICVSVNSVAKHLAHGDMLAACGTDHSCEGGAKTQPITASVESLFKVYPNPFNKTAFVEFMTDIEGPVSIEMYNALGQLTKVIYDGKVEIGMQYHFEIHADEASVGMNMIVAKYADGSVRIQKLMMNQ